MYIIQFSKQFFFARFAERGEQGGFQQQDANECWIELMGVLKRHLDMKESASAKNKSVIDTYFGLEFDTEVKCNFFTLYIRRWLFHLMIVFVINIILNIAGIESDLEPVTKSKEHFLQYNCYIDKEVKYLYSGLKNVSIYNSKN